MHPRPQIIKRIATNTPATTLRNAALNKCKLVFIQLGDSELMLVSVIGKVNDYFDYLAPKNQSIVGLWKVKKYSNEKASVYKRKEQNVS